MFFENWLKILFFEAFNNKFTNRHTHFPNDIRRILATAPYLNGGLFYENELDKAYSFTFPDALFEHVFFFLERYNFTIAEDSPLDQEVAVDPEMIGRVYESLVNVSTEIDERGEAGIFYTPRTEIDLMCRLTLVDYFTNHLGQEHKDTLYRVIFALEPHEKSEADDILRSKGLWEGFNTLLLQITVVDPACGSGSFLVGMLYVLDDLQSRANEQRHLGEVPYRRKRRIIGQSLYGVDVMPWAVHVAELRLWLTLIVDAEFSHVEDLHVRTEPLLPHLSFKIRYGDSLVQEVGGINLGLRQTNISLSPELKSRLTNLKNDKQDFYYNDTRRPSKTKEQLTQDEFRLFCDIFDSRIRALQEDIKKHRTTLEESKRNEENSMFGTASPKNKALLTTIKAEQKLLEEKETALEGLRKVRAKLTTPRDVPFVWDISFAEVFRKDKDEENSGFDIVIGNPPYVRQEKIASPTSAGNISPEAYKSKLMATIYNDFPEFFAYNTGRGDKVKHSRSDLYIYFYLHGLKLLNSKGSFCFITSNSWLDVDYGAVLQRFLLNHCRVKFILDNKAKRSFISADVNTVIVLFSSPQKAVQENLQNITRFVQFNVGFEQILVADVFIEIEHTENRLNTDFYRIHPISQQELLVDGSTLQKASEPEASSAHKSGRASSQTYIGLPMYTGNKWGGKYLRAPDIYWTIMQKGKDKLVRLGDIADVRFGIKTGANEFFYLDETKAREWYIEDEFLQPVIKSPTECTSILINVDMLKNKLFLCHKSKKELKGTAALAYIQWGESQGFHQRPSVTSGKEEGKWWTVSINAANSIFVKEAHNTSAVFYNPDMYLADCRLYYANLPTRTLVYLNSVIGAMLFEIYNRAGLGGGARSMMVSDYALVPALFSTTVNDESAEHIFQQLHPLAPRKLTVPDREWRNVDNFVFDALNLTKGERDGVYEAVIDLVTSRLDKASSFNTSKNREATEQHKRVDAVDRTLGIWMGLPEEEEEEEIDSTYA